MTFAQAIWLLILDKAITAALAAVGAVLAARWLNRQVDDYRDRKAWAAEIARARIAAIHGLNHALHELRKHAALMRLTPDGKNLEMQPVVDMRVAAIDLEEAFILGRSHVGDLNLLRIEPCRDASNKVQELVKAGGCFGDLEAAMRVLHEACHAAAEHLALLAQDAYTRPLRVEQAPPTGDRAPRTVRQG